MKYLLLLYQDEQPLANLLPGARIVASQAGDDLLHTRGQLLAGAPLQAAGAVATVCVQHEQIRLTAGPSTAVAGQLSAFYFIDVRDLNDAIHVAAQTPEARNGWVEVWPIAE